MHFYQCELCKESKIYINIQISMYMHWFVYVIMCAGCANENSAQYTHNCTNINKNEIKYDLIIF